MTDIITVWGYNQVLFAVFPDVETGNKRNYPMENNSQIKLYKNSAQTLLLEVRSLSRKFLTVTDRDFYLNIIDVNQGCLAFRRIAAVVDPNLGRLSFSFDASDLDNLYSGIYSYSVSTIDQTGNETFLFLDQSGGASSSIEIIDKAMPAFVPSTIATVFQNRIDMMSNYWTSSTYPGAGQSNFSEGLHTIAVYCTDFTGKFVVQGSLAANPTDTDWFNVVITNYDYFYFTNFTGIESFNFIGPLLWVRFVYYPDPINNTGSLDQVLYRGSSNPLPTSVSEPLLDEHRHRLGHGRNNR